MTLKCLGSNSSGNCYILESEKEVLILELGLPFSKIKEGLKFKLNKVVGALVSHEHGDHAKGVNKALEAGIDVYTSQGTINKLGTNRRLKPVQHKVVFRLGEFAIMPFNVIHDCEEPFGFYINHPESGKFFFATDTEYLYDRFDDLSNVMIECNYASDILNRNVTSGIIKPFLRDRVIKSHMSLETTIKALQANDISRVNNVVLLHLSDSNSDSIRFKNEVEAAIGHSVTIAKKGLEINFNKTGV